MVSKERIMRNLRNSKSGMLEVSELLEATNLTRYLLDCKIKELAKEGKIFQDRGVVGISIHDWLGSHLKEGN